jgi:hypothetical protein
MSKEGAWEDVAAEDIQATFNLPQEAVAEIARLIWTAYEASVDQTLKRLSAE